MDIAVLRHQQSVNLGSIATALENRGLSWRYIDVFAEDLEGFDALAPDVLISLGGSPGVYQAEHYPFIGKELKILEQRLAKDLPTFGICLGAQMIAAALGAKVYPGDAGPEQGWGPLMLTEEGKSSPVRHFAPEKTSMYHWHGDTFDLPEGATLLAFTQNYKQAYSWGDNVLAVQAHPEMNFVLLEESLIIKAGFVAKGQYDPAAMREEMAEKGPALIRQTEAFINEWLDKIAPR